MFVFLLLHSFKNVKRMTVSLLKFSSYFLATPLHQSLSSAAITVQNLPISEERMFPVSQDLNYKIAFPTVRTFSRPDSIDQRLTIAEADIIFYGEDALAGAKEFARLEVGQGFSWMTFGMSKASVVFVRRGVWALYDADSFRGRMMVVSAGDAEGQIAVHNGIHVLEALVRSYKRIR
jgi:hypothetical protein